MLNFGYSLFEDALKEHLDKSYLDIENILSEIDTNFRDHREVLDDVFDFVLDAISVSVKDIEK